MKKILSRLFEHEKLSRAEAKEVLIKIAKGEYNHVQISSFATVYNMRPISIAELQGFRDALLELCVPFEVSQKISKMKGFAPMVDTFVLN